MISIIVVTGMGAPKSHLLSLVIVSAATRSASRKVTCRGCYHNLYDLAFHLVGQRTVMYAACTQRTAVLSRQCRSYVLQQLFAAFCFSDKQFISLCVRKTFATCN